MVQFRKRRRFGPFSFGLSKRGVSSCVGVPGLRVSKGSDGKVHRLSDYKGKTVVLAWFPMAFTGG